MQCTYKNNSDITVNREWFFTQLVLIEIITVSLSTDLKYTGNNTCLIQTYR